MLTPNALYVVTEAIGAVEIEGEVYLQAMAERVDAGEPVSILASLARVPDDKDVHESTYWGLYGSELVLMCTAYHETEDSAPFLVTGLLMDMDEMRFLAAHDEAYRRVGIEPDGAGTAFTAIDESGETVVLAFQANVRDSYLKLVEAATGAQPAPASAD